jgi:hypothetical protein
MICTEMTVKAVVCPIFGGEIGRTIERRSRERIFIKTFENFLCYCLDFVDGKCLTIWFGPLPLMVSGSLVQQGTHRIVCARIR